jgi:hypothetical protein
VTEVQLPNSTGEQLPESPQPNGVQAASAAADDVQDSTSNATMHTEFVAVPCPIGTYQDKETEAKSCTPCPNGLTTRNVGADGIALCLAPPGVELLPGADNVTDCPVGSYKEGWNLNPCTSVSG